MLDKVLGILVISYPDDKLSRSVTRLLHAQGIQVLNTIPDTLGSRRISLQGDLLRIDGLPIGGVLFRVSPQSKFSDDFETFDQPFCDAEIRAILLAALNLDSILAINKYDATAWFEGLGWSTWRRALINSGIPVSELMFGDSPSKHLSVWYPYTGWEAKPVPGYHSKRILGSALTERGSLHNTLVLGKDIIAGKQVPSLIATVELLADMGISIADIVTDPSEKILTVNTIPLISDVFIEDVSHRIMEMFHAHLNAG